MLAAERLAKELPEGSASTDKLRLALAAESHRARTAFDATRNKEGWKVRARARARARPWSHLMSRRGVVATSIAAALRGAKEFPQGYQR